MAYTPTDVEYAAYQADIDKIKASYEAGDIDGYEYNSTLSELAVNFSNGGYVGSATPASTSSIATKGTGLAKGAALQSIYAKYDEEIDTYIGNYTGKGGRLTQFINNNGSTDDERIAYIKLVDNSAAMSNISSTVFDKSNIDSFKAIYKLLTSDTAKYDRFILNSVTENRAERMSLMKTVGDSFSMTFSGREPMVISASGSLVFDYDRARMSWYAAFTNAYEYYLRASVASKYRCKVKFVLPDFTIYEGYIIGMSSNQASESDITVPFSFSMVVTQEQVNRAYNNDGTVVTTPDSSLDEADLAARNEALASGNVSPETDGKKANAEVTVKEVGKASETIAKVNSTTSSKATDMQNLSKQISNVKAEVYKATALVNTVTNAIGVRVKAPSILR